MYCRWIYNDSSIEGRENNRVRRRPRIGRWRTVNRSEEQTSNVYLPLEADENRSFCIGRHPRWPLIGTLHFVLTLSFFSQLSSTRTNLIHPCFILMHLLPCEAFCSLRKGFNLMLVRWCSWPKENKHSRYWPIRRTYHQFENPLKWEHQ